MQFRDLQVLRIFTCNYRPGIRSFEIEKRKREKKKINKQHLREIMRSGVEDVYSILYIYFEKMRFTEKNKNKNKLPRVEHQNTYNREMRSAQARRSDAGGARRAN